MAGIQNTNVDPLVATAEKTHNIIENNKKVAAARAQDPLQANREAVGPKQGLNPVDVREETSFLAEPEGEAVVAQDEYDNRLNREKAAQKEAAKQRVLERLKKMRDAGYTDDEHYEAAIGNDWAAFFDDSADAAANKTASIFGSGNMWGRLTKGQRGYTDQLLARSDREEAYKKNIAEEKARQAWEDKYKFTVGEGDGAKQIHVSKEFSDKIKGIGEALARVEADDEKRGAGIEKRRAFIEQMERAWNMDPKHKGQKFEKPDMPEDVNKAKRQELVGAIREQLTAAGFDLGAVPEGGEYDNVDELLSNIPNWETENAVRKALGMAGSRTEYAPEQKSFDQMLKEREELKERAELRSRNRELERAKNRQGFAGLAATIGDMIRASQGAPVSPRDWQQMYDNLSAQEKANIDNYRVRMQKINDDARAARLMREKMAAEAAEKEKDRQWKTGERVGQDEWQGSQNEYDRALKWLLKLKDEDIARLRQSSRSGSNPYTRIMTGNTSWQLPKGETATRAIYAIVEALNKTDHKVTVTDTREIESDPKGFYDKNVSGILRTYWNELPEDVRTSIESTIKGYGGTVVSGGSSTGGAY